MFTRKQYLNGECTHEQYYEQFVTDQIKDLVLRVFGRAELTEAYQKDPNLNNIPLYHWDNLARHVNCGKAMKPCGDYPTLAGQVCILKTAARLAIQS